MFNRILNVGINLGNLCLNGPSMELTVLVRWWIDRPLLVLQVLGSNSALQIPPLYPDAIKLIVMLNPPLTSDTLEHQGWVNRKRLRELDYAGYDKVTHSSLE